jgi:WD40 repeat protein
MVLDPDPVTDNSRPAAQNSRRGLLLLVGVGALLLVVGGVVAWLLFGDEERVEADRERRIALARDLIEASNGQMQGNPELALLLAREADHTWHSDRSEETLRRALLAWPLRGSTGDEGPLLDTLFSRDGTLLATQNERGSIRLWRVGIGGVLLPTNRVIAADDDTPRSMNFSDDGELLAVGRASGEVELWDAQTGNLRASWQAHTTWVESVEFAVESNLLLTVGAEEGQIVVWKRDRKGESDGTPLNYPVLTAIHVPDLNNALLSPSGSTITAVRLGYGATQIWDVGSGHLLHTLPVNIGSRESNENTLVLGGRAHYSPDGSALVTHDSSGSVRIWDVETGGQRDVIVGLVRSVEETQLTASLATGFSYSPDGKYLAIETWSNKVFIWDTDARKVTAELSHNANVADLAWLPDGGRLVVAKRGVGASVWETDPWREAYTIGPVLSTPDRSLNVLGLSLARSQLSPDGKWLLTVDEEGTGRTWWTGVPEVLNSLESPRLAPLGVTFSPDGKWVIATSRRDVGVWEVGTGATVVELAQPGTILGSVLSPDGNWLATYGPGVPTYIWNTGTWKNEAVLPNRGTPRAAAFHRDSRWLAMIMQEGSLHNWEIESETLHDLEVSFPFNVSSMEYNQEGDRLMVVGSDRILLLDATGVRVQAEIALEDDEIRRAFWSRDGRSILALTSGGLRAWDARTGESLDEPRANFSQGYASRDGHWLLDLSRDGRWLVNLYEPNKVSIINAQTGTEMMSIPLDRDAHWVAISQGGRDIAVAGPERVWVYACEVCVGERELSALAERRSTRELTCEEKNNYLGWHEICPTPVTTPSR